MTANISFDSLRPGIHGQPIISSNRPTTSTPPLNLIAVFLAVAALLPFLLHLHQEYLAFLALGPGGTPSTFAGFLRVKALGLFALRDVYTPRAGFGLSSAKTVDVVEHGDVDEDGLIADSTQHEPACNSTEDTSKETGERRLTGRVGDLTDNCYPPNCFAIVPEGMDQPSNTCAPPLQHRRDLEQQHQKSRTIPPRKGPRPQTRGIAPHRQVTQRGSPETFAQTAAALREMAERYAGVLAVGTSCFEPHTVGLFVLRPSAKEEQLGGFVDDGPDESSHGRREPSSSLPQTVSKCSPDQGGRKKAPGERIGDEVKDSMPGKNKGKHSKIQSKSEHCGAEIAHVHPSDGSLHVVLAPRDVDSVLASAWGERHPLARGGWWERFVPEGFVMVYAPRDEREVEVVMGIVEMGVEGFLREGTQG